MQHPGVSDDSYSELAQPWFPPGSGSSRPPAGLQHILLTIPGAQGSESQTYATEVWPQAVLSSHSPVGLVFLPKCQNPGNLKMTRQEPEFWGGG